MRWLKCYEVKTQIFLDATKLLRYTWKIMFRKAILVKRV
jgi:hypothetical protein